MKLQRFDKVLATFSPRRVDDLRDEAPAAIGLRGVFAAAWLIEEGPYRGQWAMSPNDFERFRFGWVPLCDLSDVEVQAGAALHHRGATG